MQRTCENCAHKQLANVVILTKVYSGICVRYPPTVIERTGLAVFPLVLDDHTCGEYLPSPQVTENANRLIAERLENDRTKTLPQKGD